MSLERGLELMRGERWFDAHEELEEEWRDAPAAERDFLQGLVHVTVAWHHAGRDNPNGAVRQLAKARRRLERYRPAHREVDLEGILAQVVAAERSIAAGELKLPPVALPGSGCSDTSTSRR